MSPAANRWGPTHYEVLGVGSRASQEEIRSAYRRAAREAHPDRHGDASAARMAEINEAWRVLGDADRRRRYDELIADRTGASAAGSSGSAAGSAGGSGGGSSARGGVAPPMPTGDLSRFPWRFFAFIGVAAIAAAVTASIMSEPAPPPPVDGVLRQGDCVTIDPAGGLLTEVRCLQPNDGKVQIVVNFDDQCPTGTVQYREPQGLGWACILPVPA
jgi:hypothetical protein